MEGQSVCPALLLVLPRRAAMLETSRIDINLAAVSHNLRLMKRIVGPECRLCAIVKADAYGLGAVRVAKSLVAAGVDMLAVFTPDQARELINAAVSGPILILMPVREIDRTDALYRTLICDRLHLAVHDSAHLEDLVRMAERFGATLPVHLEVDTGMSRGGCSPKEAPSMLRRIAEHRRLSLAGMYTHFADAESNMEMTDEQLRAFNELLEACNDLIPSGCMVHAASTFAALRAQRFHKSMIRIGLAWAGYGIEALEGGEVIAQGEHLQPAITWTSRVTQVKHVSAGATIGYGATWRAERDSIIGVVPVGYADGYPMHAGAVTNCNRKRAAGRVAVLIEHDGETQRHFVPVVGAVNMDQITIDLTEIAPASQAMDEALTWPVELITPDATAPNHLPKLAELGGTFAHEMMCRLNSRLPRWYTAREHAAPAVNVEKVSTSGLNKASAPGL